MPLTSIVFIGVSFILFWVLVVAHQRDWIPEKLKGSINSSATAICALGILVPFLLAPSQEPSTNNSGNVTSKNSPLSSMATAKAPAASTPMLQAPTGTVTEPVKPRSEWVRVMEGTTEELFGNQLRISMYGTKDEGDPAYFRFYGQIAAPGLKPLPIRGAGPGFNVTYGKYDVTLLDVSVVEASFTIVENSK